MINFADKKRNINHIVKNGIMLADGTEVPLACAGLLISAGVKIYAIVVGPNIISEDAERIANQFIVLPRIIVTSRPDEHPFILDLIEKGNIDMLFSCYYEYRIRPKLIRGAKYGGINLHPSYLPHNAGFHSSFWGIYNNIPLGATLH